ncbi:hypothetical protein C8R45DRAFT_947607 [Mycena sanguinolenta]|nr:hypothetical protein C8R45DRAFT_947607 [Mycena sanguinolenta]
MPPLAILCNVPISTGFDGRAPKSWVSLDWVFGSGLRTRGSQLSGLLTLPCDVGVISMSLDVLVAASLGCDLVLGLDWLHYVLQNFAESLVVHLTCGSLDLYAIGTAAVQSSSSPSPAFPASASVFQENIGAEPSTSSVSLGRPSVVLTPSPMPSLRGIDVVPAGPLAAPGMPRTREIQTSRTRDGISGQDVEAAGMPAAPHTRGTQILYINGHWIANEHDPFVCISVQEKIAVVHFLVVNNQIGVLALKKMTVRHQHMSARVSGEKRKSADTLRSEFLVHKCTEACLVLSDSDATAFGRSSALGMGRGLTFDLAWATTVDAVGAALSPYSSLLISRFMSPDEYGMIIMVDKQKSESQ